MKEGCTAQPGPDVLHSLKKRLLSGSAWAFSGKMVTSLSSIVVSALLARLLSPEALGSYFLVFSLVTVAAMVAQLGMNQAVVKLVAESIGTGRPGRAARAIRLVFLNGTLGALAVALFLALGGEHWLAEHAFHSPLMATVAGLVAVWAVVLTFQGLLAESFRGFHDIRLATIFGGLVTGVLSAIAFAILWLVRGESGLEEVISISLVAGATSALVAGFLLRGKLGLLPLDGCLGQNELVKLALPQWVTNLTFFLLTRQSALWIVGFFQPQEAVAIYGAAARLVALVAVPLFIIDSVVPPIIAELYAQGRKHELERTLRTTATFCGIPSFLALVAFIGFGGSILSFVFGNYYRHAGLILSLLSLGQIVNVASGSCGLTLVMTGHQVTIMRITLICGLLTVLGAIFGAQQYGVTGVAVASATGMILQNISMLVSAKKQTGIWTHMTFRNLRFSLK